MDVVMINNLQFDRVDYRKSMQKLYAFVTCIDTGSNGKGNETKRYWGEVSERNNSVEIERVMAFGAKWEQLPI